MPPVVTSISAFKQSITGGAFEALAAATQDSLSIISFPSGSSAYVEEIISGNSAAQDGSCGVLAAIRG
jgi:hypothetical protein